MARTIVLTDDLDGTPGASSVTFSLNGAAYTIDLSDANVKRLTDALTPFAEAATPIVSRSVGKSSPDVSDARTWLKANGYDVADKGRIPENLMNEWRNRNADKSDN